MAAYFLEGESVLGASATVVCVVVPVAVYVLGILALYAYLTRTIDPFHLWLLAGTIALLAAPLVMASAGVAMAWCLVVLSVSPWVTVVGYELHGFRHIAGVLDRLAGPEVGEPERVRLP